MNLNNLFSEKIIKRIFLGICILIVLLSFSCVIQNDFDKIFKKDLIWDDESTNSVVSANLSRKIFPPMIRLNPLREFFYDWREGPYWQHIPPLFTYIPVPFFKLDNQITIEVKRLAYAGVLLLTSLIFLLSVYLFDKRIKTTAAATLAAVIFVTNEFSRNLVTGIDFGTSDLLLALTVVLSFASICWYLKEDKEKRLKYTFWKIAFIGVVISLPIITKNILGAIPATTFFLLLIRDYKKINWKLFTGFFSFLIMIFLAYAPLYLSSPETFREEIFLPFVHMKNYEWWGRPWHFFITTYFPEDYTKSFTALYYFGILLGLWFLFKKRFNGRTEIILKISIFWFIWNLAAISMIESKAPNFIFQSFIFSLFFVSYLLIFLFEKTPLIVFIKKQIKNINTKKPRVINIFLILTIIILLGVTINSYRLTVINFYKIRNTAYNYKSEHEIYYHFAEEARTKGVNTDDLFILAYSKGDIWFRYYLLFLTGSEARTIKELKDFKTPFTVVQKKYKRVFLVSDKAADYKNEIQVPHQVDYVDRFMVTKIETKDLQNNYISDFLFFLPPVKNKFPE